MEIKISKQKTEWNQSEFGDQKICVVVEFPNCISSTTKKSFKWMPTYKQLDQIKNALEEIEQESWAVEQAVEKIIKRPSTSNSTS